MAVKKNSKDGAKIKGTSSADSITNYGSNVSINAGAGNDSIIVAGGHNVTVNGGAGNDYVHHEWGAGTVYVYTGGNDTLKGFNDNTALVIADKWSSVRSDDSTVIISVKGKGKITLSEYESWRGNLEIVSSLSKAIHYNLKWNDNKKIFNGTSKDDYLANGSSRVKINGGAGNDYIENNGSYSTVDGGSGNDFIGNWDGNEHSSLNGGKGNDIFQIDSNYTTIIGGEGNDTVRSWGENTNISINSGAGDDYVHNNAHDSTILTGEGNDSIGNWGRNAKNVTINSGAGNDSIENSAENVSINAGNGNDTINSYGDNSTVAGGKGNDLINGGIGLVYVYSGGNDTLNNFRKSSTLVLGSLNINSSLRNGENGDITLNISNGGQIILQSYWEDIVNTVSSASKATHFNVIRNDKSKKTVTGTSRADFIENANQNGGYHHVTINSGAGNDHIQTNGSSVLANAGNGNDIIENWGNHVTINGGDDNDYILNYQESENVSIDGGNGNDNINIYGNNVTVAGGAGNDFIWHGWGTENLSIAGGEGADTLINDGSSKVTIAGGSGNDEIWNSGGSDATINGGRGNDEIDGYHFSNSISGGEGNDYINVRAGNSNTINGGAGKDTIEVLGWKMTVAGGTGNDSISLHSTNTLIKYKSGDGNDTIRGFNSTDTLSITGGAYSTQISGNDVLVKVGKSTITLKDAKGNAININGKNVGGSSTNTKFIKLTSGNDAICNKVDNVTISGLGGNDLIENDFGDRVSISGGAGNDTISSFAEEIWNDETNSPEVLSYPEYITINGGKGNDLIDFNSGARKSLIQYALGDGNDTIKGLDSTSTLSIAGSSYSTKNSGSDIIVTVGKGKITLKDAKGKNITYIDANGNENVYPKQKSVIYDAEGTSATLNKTYTADKFEPSDYSAYKDILLKIDASAVRHSLKITGNKNANEIVGTGEEDIIYGGAGKDTILGGDSNDKLYGEAGNDSLLGGKGDDSLWGGAGSDILTGGSGADIFFYSSGDGNDIITDYQSNIDTVMILSSVKIGSPTANSSGDVTFKVGTGQITFKNCANKHIELVDKAGNDLKHYNP